MTNTIGIIGLGRMGMPTAKKFMEAGYRVVGHDVRQEPLEELRSAGGEAVENSKKVAEKAETVIVFVLNDQQVNEVITGQNGILDGAGDDSIVICMATIDRDNISLAARRCSEKNVGFVDCPCTGGPARVEQGSLTMIAAAPQKLLETCRPVLEILGKIIYAGETPGLGQAIKHCNQLLVGTTHVAVMEIIALAKKSGLDPGLVCEVIGSGIAGSDYFRLLSASVLEDKPSPGGMGQMFKDMGLVVNDGRRVEIPLPLATAAYHYFLAAKSLGMEDRDSSKLIEVIERMIDPDAC